MDQKAHEFSAREFEQFAAEDVIRGHVVTTVAAASETAQNESHEVDEVSTQARELGVSDRVSVSLMKRAVLLRDDDFKQQVVQLANIMVGRLIANAHKGGVEDWMEFDPSDMLEKAQDELYILRRARDGNAEEQESVNATVERTADAANYLLIALVAHIHQNTEHNHE